MALLAIRIDLPFSAPFSMVVAVLLLPVTARYLARFRSALLLTVAVLVAVLCGAALTAAVTTPTSISTLIAQSIFLCSIPAALAVMLWARSLIGVRRVALSFGVGLLANVVLTGLNAANPWKFSLSLPLTLILLSSGWVYGRRWVQLVGTLALAGVSIAFDSRSAAGFLLIAAALNQVSRSDQPHDRQGSRTLRLAQILGIIVGAFYLLQGAILEGMLGDEIQQRTQAQIDASGSVIAGGRPEIGASWALITANPWGYGSGAIPTPSQILTAKEGMAALGYDPNNGYVENYMFGKVFEVHSVLGDLWLLFGLAGLLVVIVCFVMIIRGATFALAAGTASTVAIYASIRSLWDLGFSPLYTSLALLPLALALVAEPRDPDHRSPGVGPDVLRP